MRSVWLRQQFPVSTRTASALKAQKAALLCLPLLFYLIVFAEESRSTGLVLFLYAGTAFMFPRNASCS